MNEQLAIIVRRDDEGNWTVHADVGEAGLEHAQRMRRAFGISHEQVSFGVGILIGAGQQDTELVDAVRRFLGPS